MLVATPYRWARFYVPSIRLLAAFLPVILVAWFNIQRKFDGAPVTDTSHDVPKVEWCGLQINPVDIKSAGPGIIRNFTVVRQLCIS